MQTFPEGWLFFAEFWLLFEVRLGTVFSCFFFICQPWATVRQLERLTW